MTSKVESFKVISETWFPMLLAGLENRRTTNMIFRWIEQLTSPLRIQHFCCFAYLEDALRNTAAARRNNVQNRRAAPRLYDDQSTRRGAVLWNQSSTTHRTN